MTRGVGGERGDGVRLNCVHFKESSVGKLIREGECNLGARDSFYLHFCSQSVAYLG